MPRRAHCVFHLTDGIYIDFLLDRFNAPKGSLCISPGCRISEAQQAHKSFNAPKGSLCISPRMNQHGEEVDNLVACFNAPKGSLCISPSKTSWLRNSLPS